VTRNTAVANQFVADLETAGRESRKWNLSIGLYSQHFKDYPEIITELATSVIVLGVGTQKGLNWLCDKFGFKSSLRFSLKNLGKPGPKGASFVGLFKTSQGDVYQTLTNTISPMAIWAFSSTSEDRRVRNALYEKLGLRKTLKLLARQYPGGIKSAVERRKSIYEESGLDQEAIDVEATFIQELLEISRNQDL
jgi:intracellular multiplication protein IcmB